MWFSKRLLYSLTSLWNINTWNVISEPMPEKWSRSVTYETYILPGITNIINYIYSLRNIYIQSRPVHWWHGVIVWEIHTYRADWSIDIMGVIVWGIHTYRTEQSIDDMWIIVWGILTQRADGSNDYMGVITRQHNIKCSTNSLFAVAVCVCPSDSE